MELVDPIICSRNFHWSSFIVFVLYVSLVVTVTATSIDDFDDFEQVYPTEMNRMK